MSYIKEKNNKDIARIVQIDEQNIILDEGIEFFGISLNQNLNHTLQVDKIYQNGELGLLLNLSYFKISLSKK